MALRSLSDQHRFPLSTHWDRWRAKHKKKERKQKKYFCCVVFKIHSQCYRRPPLLFPPKITHLDSSSKRERERRCGGGDEEKISLVSFSMYTAWKMLRRRYIISPRDCRTSLNFSKRRQKKEARWDRWKIANYSIMSSWTSTMTLKSFALQLKTSLLTIYIPNKFTAKKTREKFLYGMWAIENRASSSRAIK